MTDLEFERMLNAAVLEACRRDFAGAMDDEDLKFEFSPGYLRWESKFLADPYKYAKKHTRPMWKRAVRTGLCAVLVLALTFGAVLAVSPAARQWVVEWFETHAVFTFEGESGYYRTPGNWYPEYLPDEGTKTDEHSGSVRVNLIFETKLNLNIYLAYSTLEDSGFNLDNENQIYSEVTLSNGLSAFLMEAENEGDQNQLIWADPENGIAFKLVSVYEPKELIKIAESMREEPE